MVEQKGSGETEKKEEHSSHRHFNEKGKHGVQIFAILVALYHIFYVLDVFDIVGIYIDFVLFRVISLTLVLILTFLIVPMRKADKNRLPWYDILFILASALTSVYWILMGYELSQRAGVINNYELILGTLMVIAVLEATRRTVGMIMASVVTFFMLYAFFSDLFPGFLMGPGFSFSRIIGMSWQGTAGIYGITMEIMSSVIASFLIFSTFLVVTGASKIFIDLAIFLTGRTRGGPGKAAVVASSLFGMVSGSAGGNAATIGTFTIPLMKQAGFRPTLAAAIEGSASTGGQLMPPVMGAAAFIMADFLGLPYSSVMLVAFIPAILYYLCLFVSVDVEAAKHNISALSQTEFPDVKKSLVASWLFLAPIAFLLILMIGLNYQAEKSALFSVVPLIILSFFYKESKMNLRRIGKALADGAQQMTSIASTCAAAGIILGVLNLTGLSVKLTSGLIDLAGGSQFLLLLFTAVVSLILGMGLPTTPLYILLASMVAPALINTGITPLAAHLFIFYYGIIAQITPPVCVTVYITSAIADCDSMKAGAVATRIAAIAYIVPFLLIYDPPLLLQGSVIEVLISVLVAILGVISMTFSFGGYMRESLGFVYRILFGVAAAGMFFPATLANLLGVVVFATLIIQQTLLKSMKRAWVRSS